MLEATADAPVVQVHGDVDLNTAPTLAHQMAHVAERCPERLVLDLTDVGIFDARGVAVLVSIRQLLPDHCSIVLRRPRPLVRKVLEVTEMDRVCIIEDQEE
ncbi:MAG: STAS domain-containing protein [Sciscionella sp.]